MESVRDEQWPSMTATPKKTMPHIIVKTVPGKSEQEKTRLAEEITKDVMDVLHYDAESVSVAIEEINPQDWAEKVYIPEILNNPEKLYKKPGYTM
jgi:4-oxalocrotonate tautomerase